MQSKFTGRTNQKAVGLYCDYGMPTEQDYTVLVGVQISNESAEDAKDVGKAWAEIWNTPLERTFTGDFEEYQEDCDGKTGTIFIYIAIK